MHLCDKALAATSEATLITDSCQPDNPIIYCNSGFTKLLGALQCPANVLEYPFMSQLLQYQYFLRDMSKHIQGLHYLTLPCCMLARLGCIPRLLTFEFVIAGYTMNEVVGRNARFMQGPDSDPEAIAELRDAVSNGRATVVELINLRKDGTRFWNQVHLGPLKIRPLAAAHCIVTWAHRNVFSVV